jgi:gamma-glutamyl:cysteine ligase YbdK (ATP-grasp superfamily)
MGKWHLFEVTGVEIEYMIVDRTDLSVRPLAEKLLQHKGGRIVNEFHRREITWSNELVAHVLEMKTSRPVADIAAMIPVFQRNVETANRRLEPFNACLLPSAAHPWMNPERETVLWPYGHREIYDTYNGIFDCRGHGWSNLQSVHINLPFDGDAEFGRLHAAIRAALPLLPAIAASSPVLDGKRGPALDMRLKVYETNQKAVPEIAGNIIPEAAFTEAEYNAAVFEKVKTAIAPLDPDRILDPYFLNSRGAIARFDRGSIEIRILDSQECVSADLALAEATVKLVKALAEEHFAPLEKLKSLDTIQLKKVFDEAAMNGLDGVVFYPELNTIFNAESNSARFGDYWQSLSKRLNLSENAQVWLEMILREGSLARRMLRFTGEYPTQKSLERYLERLASCLQKNCCFIPELGEEPYDLANCSYL